MAQQTKKTVASKEKLSESEGLAPIARLILSEGFRTSEFQTIYKDVLEVSNALARGEDIPKDQLDAIVSKVEEHIEHIEEYYSAEVQDIMRNYFIRLNQRLREWHVKNKTPATLEELKEVA